MQSSCDNPNLEENMSATQKGRCTYSPDVPPALKNIRFCKVAPGETAPTPELVQKTFRYLAAAPTIIKFEHQDKQTESSAGLNFGVLFCGRQAPGGHNIVTAIHDAAKELSADSKVYGFLGGTQGLIENKTLLLDEDKLRLFRNQGGYHLLGRTKDKIEYCNYAAVQKTCESLDLQGLILVGSIYTLTDAAYLAEFFLKNGVGTKVIGVPASIDNEMKSVFIPQAVGFDTATKVYSQLIGNIAVDGASARKYYYFMRLMGRSPSHIALECGLQTQSNITILSEEVEARKLHLKDVVNEIADVVCARQPRNFGTILIPEGLIEIIPEFKALIEEIAEVNATTAGTATSDGTTALAARHEILSGLTPYTRALFADLPERLQDQLLLERTSRGNLQFSQVSTEMMLAHYVEKELSKRKKAGTYNGKFKSNTSFFGYQARCALPSNFDCNLATSLGKVAVKLVAAGLTGYVPTMHATQKSVSSWKAGAVSIAALMEDFKIVDGKPVPAIGISMVDLKGKAFETLKQESEQWKHRDAFVNYGPIQFDGPAAGAITATLRIENEHYLERIESLHATLEKLRQVTLPGCSLQKIEVASQLLGASVNVLNAL